MPRNRTAKVEEKEGVETTPATQIDEEVREVPPTFDLVGEDGRRLCRSWSHEACVELKARIEAETGEELEIVDASPFSAVQLDTGA